MTSDKVATGGLTLRIAECKWGGDEVALNFGGASPALRLTIARLNKPARVAPFRWEELLPGFEVRSIDRILLPARA